MDAQQRPEHTVDRLAVSVAETAAALGVSDDLIYELIAHGDLPCLHIRRRKVIPLRAIHLVLDAALDGFDPQAVARRLRTSS